METPDAFEFPNAALIYNYTLGGTLYRPVDQAAADFMFTLLPSTPKWVRMLRDFLQQAAQQLSKEGFHTFIDFAAGLPTEDHIHHGLPGAKVVYSDIDRDTVAKARELIAGNPNVLYLEHDIRQAKSLLQSPEVQAFIGDDRRVAIGLNGISVFLDPRELRRLFHDLYEWAAPGSKLYITYETKAPNQTTPQLEQFLEVFRQSGAPFWLYSLEECLEFSQPWQLPSGGLQPLSEFLGLPADFITDEDREGVGLEFYAAILEKPLGEAAA